MRTRSCLMIAVLSGTACSTAFAQKGVVAAQPRPERPHGALRQVDGVIYPSEFRQVRLINGQIMPMGPWMRYTPPVIDLTPTLCFDGYHNAGGAAPSTPQIGRAHV